MISPALTLAALTYPQIDPVALQLGPLSIHWYGIGYVVSILFAWWYAKRLVATWNAVPVELTLTEFWMVHTLAKFPGHVKDRDQLMHDAKLVVDEGTITSHIKRIRRKFQALDPAFDRIDTVYGMGYRWIEGTGPGGA